MIRSVIHLQTISMLLCMMMNAQGIFGQNLQLLPEKDTIYICPNEPFELGIPVQGGVEPYTYAWSTGESESVLDILLSPLEEWSVSLTVTDTEGTVARADVLLIALEECVYPGDANGDRLANNYDLLEMGRAFGRRGGVRPDAHTNFIGQTAPAWPSGSTEGVNHVHSDADGNGVVDLMDIEVIKQNYTSSDESNDSLTGTSDGAPFFLEMPTEALSLGDTVNIPIILGTNSIPALDIYGIAFTISFDTDLVRENGLIVNYDNSWMGELDRDIATLDYYNEEAGKLEIGITKIDQLRTSGAGRVADITVMIEDIAGRLDGHLDLVFEIKDLKLLNQFGEPIAANAVISNKGVVLDREEVDLRKKIFVENPVTNSINIWANEPMNIDNISVLDLSGRKVFDRNQVVASKLQISTALWPKGVYILLIKFRGKLDVLGNYKQKLMIR